VVRRIRNPAGAGGVAGKRSGCSGEGNGNGELYFSPGLMEYVPLSASVPFLPVALFALLRVLAPLGIVGLATLGAFLALARTGTNNLLAITLVFVLTDAVLSLMAYGPGLALLA